MPPVISRAVGMALWLAARTTQAADCGPSTFGILATSPTVSLCMKDSNIPVLTMGTAPTPEQLGVVCKTPTCRQLLQLLVDLNAQECTIPLAGRLRLRADLIDPAVAYCAGAGLPLTAEATTNTNELPVSGANVSASTNDTTTNVPAPTSIASQTSGAHVVVGTMSVVVASLHVLV